jgi:transposase|tara:strand:- start:22 stop:1431 length:1410 start_codon:yes stop_codon:yes gene_type:complete
MSTPTADPACPGCAALRAEMGEMKQQFQAQIDALQETVTRLQKNSSNSSKPPSSDIVKPPKPTPKKGKKRRQGGQWGHTKYERTFSLEDADVIHAHHLDCCPSCASPHLFHFAGAEHTHYQYELVEQPILLHAHQSRLYSCIDCDQIHAAPFPDAVRLGGLVGPQLTGLIGYLKGSGHLSYTTLQALLDDGLGAPFSTGMLAKVVGKVSQALAPIYQPLLDALADQKRMNIDETGHKDQGDLLWTWVFAAPAFTVYHIADTRSSQVLEDLLTTECEAVLGHDCFSAYRAYMARAPVTVQFCLAHLIRELRFISESTNAHIAAYGQRLLDQLKALFRLIHRRDQLKPETFQRRIEQIRDDFLQKARRTQAGGAAATLAQRFRTYGRDYFTFITCPDIEPTNNVAERALRFCVIDRRITQGTRGRKGQQWCERFWTLRETCRQRGISVCRFMQQAVHASFQGATPPSLLPN